MQKGLSVVIPNYNGVHLFPHTLPTVFAALNELSFPTEVLLVDDASTDGSVAFLQQHFPQVKTTVNENNSGFAVTANKAVRQAAYPLVLLLNSDVKLERNYFAGQLPFFMDAATFGVMGCIRGWHDDAIQDGAKYPVLQGAKIKTSGNYLLKEESAMNAGLLTMYLSGANALMEKEKFLQLGGFNEIFSPFYVEDYELSLRAWRAGWQCYFHYPSVCRHKTSATISTTKKKRYVDVIYNRNKFYLHAIHLSPAQQAIWAVQVLLEAVIKLVTFKWTYVKSLWLFISSYKKVPASKKQFRAATGGKKLLSVTQVAATIKASLNGKEISRFK